MADTPEPPLARSVGAFVGHIVDAIVREPQDAGPPAVQTRRTTQEFRSSEGVLLRRTVIDEVIVPEPRATPPAA